MKNKYSIFSLIKNAFSGHENWQRAWRDPEPKKEYDAIIIGGGGHGLATAYYLAKKTLCIDRGDQQPANGTANSWPRTGGRGGQGGVEAHDNRCF